MKTFHRNSLQFSIFLNSWWNLFLMSGTQKMISLRQLIFVLIEFNMRRIMEFNESNKVSLFNFETDDNWYIQQCCTTTCSGILRRKKGEKIWIRVNKAKSRPEFLLIKFPWRPLTMKIILHRHSKWRVLSTENIKGVHVCIRKIRNNAYMNPPTRIKRSLCTFIQYDSTKIAIRHCSSNFNLSHLIKKSGTGKWTLVWSDRNNFPLRHRQAGI